MRCGMGWLFHDKAGIAAPGSRRIGGPRQKMLLPCLSALDMECRKEALRRVPALQRVTGLAQAMRNIDDGERIGAFDAQTIAMGQQASILRVRSAGKSQFGPRGSRGIEEH